MAFKEFETEEAFNTEIEGIVSERVNKLMEDKNPWLNDRLQTARNAAIKETEEKYADYQTLKDSIEGETGYKAQIAKLEEQKKAFADSDKKIAAAELQNHKLSAALKFGISPDDVKRITGETEEEIYKDAEAFAKMHVSRPGYPSRSSGAEDVDGVTAAFMKLNPNIKI